MNLFIIGNGFDLGHRLPTTYNHFRAYLKDNHSQYLSQFENMYRLAPFNYKGSVRETLWTDFESYLPMFDEDEFTDRCLSLVSDLGLNGGDYGVEDTLDYYWEEQYSYIKRLNSLVKSWVETIDIKKIEPIENLPKTSLDLFLTFNYTLVLEEIYQVDKHKILHIHGSIENGTSNIPIMGHGEISKIETIKHKIAEARKIYDDWTEKECSVYKAALKYYERTYKDVNYYLTKNLNFFEMLKQVNEIFIIGHSLGAVDMPYFEAVKSRVRDDVIWNVYYYQEEEELIFMKKILSLGVKRESIKMLSAKNLFY